MGEHTGATKPILDYDQLFPGEFLKAGLFRAKPVTLTVTTIETRDLPTDKGGEKTRGIIGFRETKMKLVLVKTNGECINAMFGFDDTVSKHISRSKIARMSIWASLGPLG
jgi:hypothetical protein